MLDYKRAKGSPSPLLSNQQPIPKSGFSFSLPNSALLQAAAPTDSGLDERMRYRLSALLGQDPAAEAEADRLSKGVQASTPEGVKSEMGRRLGADLSGVRLHTGGAEAERADHMGANAFTVGRDVYFGSGGFRAGTAAHEMVHTVQQGAAEGGVSVFVPMGSVQMEPKFDEDMINFKVWAKKYKFRKLGREIEDLNKLVNKNPDSDTRWDMLRGNIMDKIREYCHDASSEDPWVNEFENVFQKLRGASKPAIVEANMENFQTWVDENMNGNEEEFDMDEFFMENDPVFASVSNEEGADVVGSIYFGDKQGLQGGRIRLTHWAGPEIELSDHVFRYSSDKDEAPPKEPKEQVSLMKNLIRLWPGIKDLKDPLALPKDLAELIKSKKITVQENPGQIRLPDAKEQQDILSSLKDGDEKEALQAYLGGQTSILSQTSIIYILKELGKSINSASSRGLQLIDYANLNEEDVKANASKDRHLVEYLMYGEVADSHESRGRAKSDNTVMRLGKTAKEDLIQAVRYSIKLRNDFINEEWEKSQVSTMNEQQQMEFIQKAAVHANNFLYAFMSEHNELKHIPVSVNTKGFKPDPAYYKKPSGGKKEEEEQTSPLSPV